MIQALVASTLLHRHLGESANGYDLVINIHYIDGTKLSGDTTGVVDTAVS